MADVLSYPPTRNHSANNPSTSNSLGPRRLPSEDILTETLAYPDADRDYTDDLEDLVSIQVTQQLHSRRSQQTINTISYLPTRESSSFNSFQNLPLSSSDSPSPTSPTQRSLIPIRQNIPSSRSPSPEVPRERDVRSGSISSSHSLSRIPSPINLSGVAMARGNSGGSNTTTSSETGREDRWETLQVGNKQLSNRTKQPLTSTTPSSSSSSKPFPSTSSTSIQPKPSPDNSTNPRKRAQTNLTTSSPSSSFSSSTTTPRKPYQNRTNLVPSPSSNSTRKKKISSTTPPVRRKSLSSTPREFSSYPSYSDHDAFPLPLPLASNAPQVFRDENGEFREEGRADQLVIPTVARRIEAERLKKLMENGEGVLVSEWGVDGLPRMEGKWKERTRRDVTGEGGEQKNRGQEEMGEDRGVEEVRSDHPYATTNVASEPQLPQLGDRKTTSTSNPPGQTIQAPTTSTKEKERTAEKNTIPSQTQRDKDIEKAGCCSCVIC